MRHGDHSRGPAAGASKYIETGALDRQWTNSRRLPQHRDYAQRACHGGMSAMPARVRLP
jgi:hypothetical protein